MSIYTKQIVRRMLFLCIFISLGFANHVYSASNLKSESQKAMVDRAFEIEKSKEWGFAHIEVDQGNERIANVCDKSDYNSCATKLYELVAKELPAGMQFIVDLLYYPKGKLESFSIEFANENLFVDIQELPFVKSARYERNVDIAIENFKPVKQSSSDSPFVAYFRPSSWTKDAAYEKLIREFQRGSVGINIAVVFNDKGLYSNDFIVEKKPYYDVIQLLSGNNVKEDHFVELDFKGIIVYYDLITVDKLDFIYQHPLVANIIPLIPMD